jgi:cbb3-type cytochrome oxidase maturation protein
MSVIVYLLPIALTLGLLGLVAFFWALRHQQFDDPEGDANRILFGDDGTPQQPDDESTANAAAQHESGENNRSR